VVELRRVDARPEVRRAVKRFLALNLLAIVVVAAGAIFLSVYVARGQAVDGAARSARSIASGIVAPLLTPALEHGDPAAVEELDKLVRNRMRDGSLLRVKVWNRDGRIVYSDAKSLIGESFELEDEDIELFGTTRAVAEISALDRPENGLEAAQAKRLVETYVGIHDTAGDPLLFEAYFPVDRLDANARTIAWQLTPVALLTIVALQLLQLPLALVLARRLDHAHREHGRLLEHAVAASDLERRRIARDLHDGVIQDLAGVAYMLNALDLQLPAGDERLRRSVSRAAGIVQVDVRALRQTMVDLYPPDLSEAGLEPAVQDLVVGLRQAGIDCEIQVPDTAGLSELTLQLLYRSARELLRNVTKHAQATEVKVTVVIEADRAVLTIADNGVGFEPDGAPVQSGHLGLRLLDEAVRDAGGRMTIVAAPGAGTSVQVEVVTP
jgi:signal transduction histidine kinase